MKNCIIAVMSILLVMPAIQSKGQFLNRLKREVERSVEDAVIQKSADEAAEKTQEAMDKMFEAGYTGLGNMKDAKLVTRDALPDSYSFQWIYRLLMEGDEDDLEIVYRLKKGADYFATSVPSTMDMLMVLDQGRGVMVTYMENEDSKMATAMELPELEVEESEREEGMNTFTIKKTGNTKTILGYECEEIVGENEEYKYIMYHTREADVTFNDHFKQDQGNLPEGVDEELLKEGMGMMMEMELINKNKSKNNIKMRCVELSEDSFSINNDDYQFFAM